MTAKNKYLEVNREVIVRLVDNGVLLVEKRGNVIRIHRSDLNRLIEAGKLPADIRAVTGLTPRLTPKARRRKRKPVPSRHE